MEIQQLRGFLAVAKCKSFSQAAKKTFRTQPAISLQIKALEDELGVMLLDRLGTQKIALTNEGKILFELASPIIDDLGSLQSRFNEIRGATQKGKVTIATHSSVMVHILPDIIRHFKKKYPKCDLSIVNRDRNGILTMLDNGDVDIGITSLTNIPDTIDYKVFARFKRILIAAKGHPISKKSLITPEDLVTYPMLLPPKGSNTRAVIDRVFEQSGLKYTIAMEITGKTAIKTYVEMNLGIAIINGYYLSGQDKKKLFVKNVENCFGEAERGVLTRKNKYLSVHAKEFIHTIFL